MLSSVKPGPVPMQELVVANFRTKHFSEEVKNWKDQADIPAAMSCSRQVWFGLKRDFTDFPDREQKQPHLSLYEGDVAYKFLLRLALGLDSKIVTEDRIKGQILECWNAYRTDDAAKMKSLSKIVDDIKADRRFVIASTLDGYKLCRHELCARDLSGQKKGDVILVIGSLNNAGAISDFTDGIARVTGNNRSTRVAEIIVSNPKPSISHELYDEMMELKQRGILAAYVTHIPFDRICKAIERANHVYVDLQMGRDIKAEEFIQLAWHTRIRKDNNLVMFRGAPEEKGFSNPFWQNAELDSYISPEQIRQEMASRSEHNSRIVDLAEKAVDFCVELRGRGQSPSHAKVRNYIAEITAQPLAENERSPVLALQAS